MATTTSAAVLAGGWGLCLLLCLSGVAGDICAGDIDPTMVQATIHRGAVPKAGKDAGIYSKDVQAQDLVACVESCCDSPLCNLVFFHQQVCYHIQCNTSFSGGCDPEPQSSPKYNSTILMVVRSVKYDSPAVVPTARECEYGILEMCHANEECVLREGSKSRMGVCQCLAGFVWDSQGVCVAATSPPPTSQASSTPGPQAGESSGDSSNQAAGMGPAAAVSTTSTTVPPATQPPVVQLMVSAGGNKEVQLPDNSISLSAFALPAPVSPEAYQYEWTLVSSPQGPETGEMDGKNSATLKLSKLIKGLYQFKVSVRGDHKFGETYVNVTVLPAARTNKAPVAIIHPTTQEVKSSNTAILDGQESTDDDKIVSYQWQEVKGPLQNQTINSDAPMLTLKNLAPGNYTFRLTVTDSDGVSNSTEANVTVIKETNYPPKANAGSDVILHLPQKSVVLYGNASTDDKAIVSYEWMPMATNKATADMTGTRSPFLTLNNLEVGDYTFTLKVTDEEGLSSESEVHVFVKPETNAAPVAKTAGQVELFLPADSLVLDGKASTDDRGIVSYSWQQTGGPTTLAISNKDRAMATATGEVRVGEYTFQLTVEDAVQQQSSDTLKVIVKQNNNQPPVAKAGGDHEVFLPVSIIAFDGRASSDDRGIVDFQWTRDPRSLAVGDVLNKSDHKAVLELTNVVAGRYIFTLTVTDNQGLAASDMASILVRKDPHETDLIELLVDVDVNSFTEENKKALLEQLQLLLHKPSQDGNTVLEIRSLGRHAASGYLHLVFLVKNRSKETEQVQPGQEVLHTLRQRLSDRKQLLDFSVVSLNTLVCQNNCSGHGHCDQRSKRCVCEAFWMENFISARLFTGESNCDWSILYVVIVCFIIVITVVGGAWGAYCLLKSKKCRLKTKKRHRYSLLREVDDDEGREKLELMPRAKLQSSSLMISESDFSSDEETLFVNNKKANGHVAKPLNGLSRSHMPSKAKA